MAYSVTECNNALDEIKTKRSDYKEAKENIKTAKGTCNDDVERYATTVSKIKGDLLQMKKDNAFEGELANKLTKEVSNFKKDLDLASKKADKLGSAADLQISKIDLKIAELDKNETIWNRRLTEAQAAVTAAATAAAAQAAAQATNLR